MGRAFWIATFIWAVAVLGGNAWLWAHAIEPGEPAEPRGTWPPASGLQRQAGKATLIMFAHPKCPCTRASLSELARLMARVGDKVTAYVVFARPDGVDDAWMQTDSVERAQGITGVTVIMDGVHGEAEAFGANTSGTVVLFSADGARVFNGGITAGRGHEGTSDGQRRIVALLAGDTTPSATDVYGCALAQQRTLEPPQ